MDQTSNTNIYEIIRELGVVGHKKRQEFLVSLIEGIIKSRSVHFSEIADKIDKPIKTSSIERRIQDFFEKVSFDYRQLGVFLLSFIHHDKVLLSIDRTEWDYGETQINILCVVVSIGKMAVPLYFEQLDNNSGNSSGEDRISLFQELISLIGKARIEKVVMDREFIGNKWLRWLKTNKLSFCVRVPKHHKLLFGNGDCLTAAEALADQKVFYAQNVVVDQVVVNLSLSYGQDGELLYLIGDGKPTTLKKEYKRRWGIEVFFQALKSRGFNMEKSCLRCLEKYRKLFAVVCMAYTICWATGIQDSRINPVKPKKHGYPQFSVFRRGLNLMREFYKNKITNPLETLLQVTKIRLKNLILVT